MHKFKVSQIPSRRAVKRNFQHYKLIQALNSIHTCIHQHPFILCKRCLKYYYNTVIGKNTFIDNQVHIAHNNKIGENCIIAGQVGFAGSSTLGNNVMIGGQAGISGHLKIGNNVQIGGGSGVIKNIPDNTKQMGYPAKDLKKFIKDNK